MKMTTWAFCIAGFAPAWAHIKPLATGLGATELARLFGSEWKCLDNMKSISHPIRHLSLRTFMSAGRGGGVNEAPQHPLVTIGSDQELHLRSMFWVIEPQTAL